MIKNYRLTTRPDLRNPFFKTLDLIVEIDKDYILYEYAFYPGNLILEIGYTVYSIYAVNIKDIPIDRDGRNRKDFGVYQYDLNKL